MGLIKKVMMRFVTTFLCLAVVTLAMPTEDGPDIDPLAQWINPGLYNPFPYYYQKRSGFLNPLLMMQNSWTVPSKMSGPPSLEPYTKTDLTTDKKYNVVGY